MSTFQDVCGDYVDVTDSGEYVYLDSYENDKHTELQFTVENAKALALDIFQRAGGSDEGPVLASNISFNEGVIRLAAIHNKCVEFRYVKGPGSPPETRRFTPSGVQGNGDKLRFVGKDPDRDDDYRSFRLDRIKGTVGVIA
jgi:hypothetical protein